MAIKIVFVCLGNICRSPAAEGVFKKMVSDHGFADQFEIDSAGTSGSHVGELADKRMREHAKKCGYELTSRSRKFEKEDLNAFDLILVMDDKNLKDVAAQALESQKTKIQKITDYCQKNKLSYVPDPYYGGDEGFENVIDILEDACHNLLQELKNK